MATFCTKCRRQTAEKLKMPLVYPQEAKSFTGKVVGYFSSLQQQGVIAEYDVSLGSYVADLESHEQDFPRCPVTSDPKKRELLRRIFEHYVSPQEVFSIAGKEIPWRCFAGRMVITYRPVDSKVKEVIFSANLPERKLELLDVEPHELYDECAQKPAELEQLQQKLDFSFVQ